MIFYTLPWSRWNRTHKYVRCTVRDSRIRSEMSWSSIHVKIWTVKQLHQLHSVWIMKIFNVMLLNPCSRNKRRKNCEVSRWRSQSALVRPLAVRDIHKFKDRASWSRDTSQPMRRRANQNIASVIKNFQNSGRSRTELKMSLQDSSRFYI